jgi:excisionase family DNA binding protein
MVRCSVCDFEMGDARELQALVAGKGHDTPEEWGIDPDEATWMCGTHKNDIGDPDWDEDEPYWYGHPSKSPEETMVALAELTDIGYDTLVKACREGRLQARQSGSTWLSTREAVQAALKAGTIQPRNKD